MLRILNSRFLKEISSLKFSTRFASEVSIVTATTQISSSSPSTADQSNGTDVDDIVDIPNPFEQEKQNCILCKHNITPNYKNVRLLSQFQSPYTGRIYGRHITGLCKKRQEQVEKEITKTQNCALMPSYHKAVEYLHDPQLFNPEKPIRPHKY